MERIHRVVLRLDQKTRRATVSCKCRAVFGKHSRNPPDDYHEPMPYAEDGDSIWTVYNNPENHWAEFTDRDKVLV